MLTDTPSLEENLEVYYRNRKDSDSAWGKEILLSKGLDFAFHPSIAVEGDNVVVVFSGYRRNKNRAKGQPHGSEIFVTTSSNGGKKWTPPLRVTDNAQAGLDSERPQVVLHNNVIHLFYVAGGLTYMHKPFPSG